VAVTKSTASRARSKLLTLIFDTSQLPSLRNQSMADWSAGYRAVLVRRQLTPGLISSLRRTAGLLRFINFSTSYPRLNLARPTERIRQSSRNSSLNVASYVRDGMYVPSEPREH
jgi:hypothetical protein